VSLVSRRSGWVGKADLPEHFTFRPGAREGKEDERVRVVRALQNTEWNKSRAARELKWSRMTLYRKMARYEITRATAQTFRSKSAREAG
jgi:transcriptional regulator of acetoin/glycerol metabolism